jgi:hypothetical protein
MYLAPVAGPATRNKRAEIDDHTEVVNVVSELLLHSRPHTAPLPEATAIGTEPLVGAARDK